MTRSDVLNAAVATGLAVVIGGPLIMVLVISLGGRGLSNYIDLLARAEVRHVLVHTLAIACVSSISAIAVGLPAAVSIAFLPGRWRFAVFTATAIVGFTPFLVRGYAFVGLLGGNDPFGAMLPGPSLLGTSAGVTIALVHALLPPVILIIGTAVTEPIKAELRMASVLGAGQAYRWVLVGLPRLRRAISSAFLLSFVTAAGAFVAPALMGGGRDFMAVQLVYFTATDMADLHAAAALAMILGIVVMVPVMAHGLGTPKSRPSLMARLLSFIPAQFAWVAAGIARAMVVAVVLLILIPPVYVIAVSFQGQPMLALPVEGLSLRWYFRVFTDPSWVAAMAATLRISVSAALGAVVTAYLAASVLDRAPRGIGLIVTGLALMPAVIPAVIFGIGLYAFALRTGLVGTEPGVAAAHALLALPMAFLVLRAALQEYDNRWDLVARVLGAGRLQTLLAVRLPILALPLLASVVLAMLVSFDEVIVTLLLAGGQVQTVGIRMWISAAQNIGPELAVPGTVLVVTAVIAGLVFAVREGSLDLLVRRKDVS